MAAMDLKKPVGVWHGKKCDNLPADVKLVKERLNAHAAQIGLKSSLDVRSPDVGPKTIAAIEGFQKNVMRKDPPYGRIVPMSAGGTTLAALLKPPAKSKKKWRIAPSVRAALTQATELWPRRSQASDGTIGDHAHSKRKSDHNPDADGVVHAFDLTHDPKNKVDCEALSALLVKRKDARVSYIIWNRQICNCKSWKWVKYSGANPHTKHMHVSIKDTSAAENDLSAWWK
jgi:hypothetical protein